MTFDIRNYIDSLIAVKNSKYECPCCGKHNLSINPNTGAYRCWNGCESRDIRAVLAPTHTRHLKAVSTVPAIPVVSEPPALPIVLATVPKYPKPPWGDDQIPIDDKWYPAKSTVYRYSPFQFVKRIEATVNGKRYKTFRQYHYDDNGVKCNGKGQYLWEPYLLRSLLPKLQGNGILLVEGEKCAQWCLQNGIAATTLQGSSWDEWTLWLGYQLIGKARFVVCPDNDDTGKKKAQIVKDFARRMQWYTPEVAVPSHVNDLADLSQIELMDWFVQQKKELRL